MRPYALLLDSGGKIRSKRPPNDHSHAAWKGRFLIPVERPISPGGLHEDLGVGGGSIHRHPAGGGGDQFRPQPARSDRDRSSHAKKQRKHPRAPG